MDGESARARIRLTRLLLILPFAVAAAYTLRLRSDVDDVLILGAYNPRVFAVLAAQVVSLAAVCAFAFTARFAKWVTREESRVKTWLLVIWALLLFPQILNLPFLSHPFHGVYLMLGAGLGTAHWPALMRAWRALKSPQGLKAVATVAASSIVTLLVLEGLLRVWVYWIAPPEALNAFFGKPGGNRVSLFVPHPYLNFSPRPDYRKDANAHNSQGYRQNRDIPVPKTAGEYRIVAIGGSTTYGIGDNNWRHAYPIQLQGELRKKYGLKRVRVINAGVPAYASWESLINLQFRVLDLQPDLIINYDGINDVHARIVAPEIYRADNTGHRRQWDDSGVTTWPYEVPSELVRLIWSRLELRDPVNIDDLVWQPASPVRTKFTERAPHLGMTPLAALQANPPVYLERNLRNMISIARANGAEMVLMTCAIQSDYARQNDRYAGAAHYRFAVDEQNALIRNLARELNAPLVDLAAEMPMNPGLWVSDGVHFTGAGNRRVARIVAAAIHERVLQAAGAEGR